MERITVDPERIKRRNEKKRLLSDIPHDTGIDYDLDSMAFNQNDLLDALNEGRREIYLCSGKFDISLDVTNVTYIGLDHPTVIVFVSDNVNFAEKNINFRDIYYVWDVSRISSDDRVKCAEELFCKGEYNKALEIAEEFAEQGNPRAMLLVYQIYEGFVPNWSKCQKWKERLMQDQCFLTVFTFEWCKDADAFKIYLPLLKKYAEKGDTIDICAYAELICYFDVPDKDSDEGRKLLNDLTLSCEKGYIPAIRVLVSLEYCEDGENVEWYRKAAERGDVTAQYDIGDFYCDHCDGLVDAEEAEKWNRIAAENGYAKAQFRLGEHYSINDIYLDQETFDKSEECRQEAVKWFRKAAEQNYVSAQWRLGWCYEIGDGVPINYEEAIKWYKKAADQNDAKALYRLGCCYETGKGVSKNREEAFNYYQKAAEHGHQSARDSLERLSKTHRG